MRSVQFDVAAHRWHQFGAAAADRRTDHCILTDHQRTSAIIEIHLAQTARLRRGLHQIHPS